MAETSEGEHATRRPRSNWVPLGVATGVFVLVGAGWPLVNALTPSTEPVAADRDITVGSDGTHSASLSLPQSGWEVDTTATRAGQNHLFLRGPVHLRLASVTVPGDEPATAEELWEGLERTSRIGDSSARLGPPERITTTGGDQGLAGELNTGHDIERAAVYPSPDGRFAVEMILGGEDATSADLDAVEDALRSLTFEEEAT